MCNVLFYRFISPYLSEGMSIYQTFSESITPRLISKYFIYIVLVCFKSKPFVRRGYLSGVTFTGRIFKEGRSSKLKLRVYILDKTSL